MPTETATTIAMLVRTASIRRSEREEATVQSRTQERERHKTGLCDGLRSLFKADFTTECVQAMQPELKIDYHTWPGKTKASDEEEGIAAEFFFPIAGEDFADEQDKMRCLLWRDNGRDWHLSWIDKAGLCHDIEFAQAFMSKPVDAHSRTESLYKAIHEACQERRRLAAQAAKQLQEALAAEQLTKQGRWRLEECLPDDLQHTLNAMQVSGLDIKYIFPPVGDGSFYRVVGWKIGVGV